MTKSTLISYLPDEQPPVWRLFLYALQQVVVMFPATVAVAIIRLSHFNTMLPAVLLLSVLYL